jgi:hypothetical protein
MIRGLRRLRITGNESESLEPQKRAEAEILPLLFFSSL